MESRTIFIFIALQFPLSGRYCNYVSSNMCHAVCGEKKPLLTNGGGCIMLYTYINTFN